MKPKRNDSLEVIVRERLRSFVSTLLPTPFISPDEWCPLNVNISKLTGNPGEMFSLENYPHLRAPLREFDFRGKRKVLTCVGVEQTGKTILEIAGFVFTRRLLPGPALIIYPDDGLAKQIDKTKVRPVLEMDPVLGPQLRSRSVSTGMSYRFSDSTTYYLGSGSPITSLSAQVVFCDELDTWLEYQGEESSLTGANKRTRSFDESLRVDVCTPRGTASESLIWADFSESSQNYYHLRCLGCGELTMRSCDIHNLQWDTDDQYNILEDTLRLICPVCHREHLESEKVVMIRTGDYIPQNIGAHADHPGFQWGALVSLKRSLSWKEIAKTQMKASSTGTYKDQLYFFNSIRGIPMRHGAMPGKREAILRKLCRPTPEPSELKQRWISIDVQTDRFYYVVRGMDVNASTHLLASGQADTWDALDKLIKMPHAGGYINYGIIDTGFRTKEVYSFLKTHACLIGYKGNPHIGCDWKVSTESKRLILANPNHYKVELLDSLYERLRRYLTECKSLESAGKQKPPQRNFLFLPQEIPQMYLEQILDISPNNKVRGGHAYDKWESSNANDHLFDAEKMMLVFRDYFFTKILPSMKK